MPSHTRQDDFLLLDPDIAASTPRVRFDREAEASLNENEDELFVARPIIPFDRKAWYDKAVANLNKKLSKIPARVFLLGSKPTLEDIFKTTEACDTPHIAPEYDLEYLFENHHLFEQHGFQARKTLKRSDVGKATWYWGMDKFHSFDGFHTQVLANVLVAAIVTAMRLINGPISDSALDFMSQFLDAFISANLRSPNTLPQKTFLDTWHHSDYDLIRFSIRNRDIIMAAMTKLKGKTPDTPFNIGRFLNDASNDIESLKKNVSTWAFMWLIDTYEEGKWAANLDKTTAAAGMMEQNMDDFLSGMNMSEDRVPEYVQKSCFYLDLVEALMNDGDDDDQGVAESYPEYEMEEDGEMEEEDETDEMYEVLPPDEINQITFDHEEGIQEKVYKYEPWMNQDDAMKLIFGELEGLLRRTDTNVLANLGKKDADGDIEME